MKPYRIKDTAPQMVKDIENEPEEVVVHLHEKGYQVARVFWRSHMFEEILPRGIETWSPDEIRSIMKNVSRKLKVKVAKAKWEAMSNVASETVQRELGEKDLTELDNDRLQRAQEKRAQRAAKRARQYV